MKDRLRKRRYNPNAKMPIELVMKSLNIFNKPTIKRIAEYYENYITNNNETYLGEELFPKENIRPLKIHFIKPY